jgi:hypothetical protein
MLDNILRLIQIKPVRPPMFRRVALRHKVQMAIGDIDRALALLSRLELGDADPATHPDVVQAKALLAKAQLKLGGKS